MLKTVKAIYKNEQLLFKEKKIVPKEGSEVVVIFEFKKEKEKAKIKRQALYGLWKGKFSRDYDLDEELKTIRVGWKKKLENSGD